MDLLQKRKFSNYIKSKNKVEDMAMKINMEMLNKTVKKDIPATENSKNPQGFYGFFEPREGYNKLVAYGSKNSNSKLSWIHKDYII